MHPTRTTWYFFLLCLINIFLAAPVQAYFGYAGLVITQILFFFLPAIIYAKRRGGIIEFIRLKEVPLSAFFWAFWLSLLAIPVSTFLNALMILLLERFGFHPFMSIDLAEAAFHPALMLIVFAVVPGLCEELMFRGVFLRNLDEKLPLRKAILLSSVFFGVIHFNVYNFLSPIYLGIVFSLLVHAYDSIIPAILGHTFFNAAVFYIQMVVEMPEEAPEALTLQSVLGILPLALLSLLSTIVLLRRLFLRKELAGLVPVGPTDEQLQNLQREWQETPSEEDEYMPRRNPVVERFTRIPRGVCVPLILSFLLFFVLIALAEWLMRLQIYV